jgi:hypothetical protein
MCVLSCLSILPLIGTYRARTNRSRATAAGRSASTRGTQPVLESAAGRTALSGIADQPGGWNSFARSATRACLAPMLSRAAALNWQRAAHRLDSVFNARSEPPGADRVQPLAILYPNPVAIAAFASDVRPSWHLGRLVFRQILTRLGNGVSRGIPGWISGKPCVEHGLQPGMDLEQVTKRDLPACVVLARPCAATACGGPGIRTRRGNREA